MTSLSTSDHIRNLAAAHGVSGAEDEVSKFATSINNLESDVSAEIQGELCLRGRLAEIAAIDDTEMVRLALALRSDEDLS